jgi:DNA invertase Pin-like site-specific DNA recombinase
MGKKVRCVKAVAYCRVSTGKQDLSLEAQEKKIRQYAKLQGLELVDVIRERATSGTVKLAKRPEGAAQLVADGVCHIIALKLDRLFRNASDTLTCVEEWQEAGISLHLVDMGGQSINTGSSMGKILVTMLAGFAEFERNLISERTGAAITHLKAHGEVYNHIPFGYRSEGGQMVDGKLVGAKLVADVDEQATILRMRQWKDQDISYARIAEMLNVEGVQTKQGGSQWGAQTVYNILNRLEAK